MSLEVVFDLEADGLLDSVTKIHCLSWKSATSKGTIVTYPEMVGFFDAAEANDWVLIVHNGIAYDFKVAKRILNKEYKGKRIDTLGLSWYLHHDRLKHGLEEYGEYYGIPKPKIDDWQNLTLEEYCYRCEEDCEINWKLWIDLKRKLQELYS